MVNFQCPECRHQRQLDDRVVGHAYRCPQCNAKIKHHRDGRLEVMESGTPHQGNSSVPTAELTLTDSAPSASPTPGSTTPASPKEDPAADLSGKTLGSYTLIRKIGMGGYSHVYLAEHQTLQRKVAVKILSPGIAATSDQLARLSKEAVSLAKVIHPNVVHVYDLAQDQGIPFLVLEFVEGSSLEELILAHGMLSPAQVMGMANEILKGLGAIHRAGLLHRDIKPRNILVAQDGTVKLVDFGLVHEISETAQGRSVTFIGTAEYAAPELAIGCAPDVRSDLYALGATLYKALTGKPPFTGGNPAEILRRQLYDPLIAPRQLNPSIPASVEACVLRLLDKDPEHRIQTCEDTVRFLTPPREPERKVAPKPRQRIPPVRGNRDAPLKVVAIACMVGLAIWYYFLLDGRKLQQERLAAAREAARSASMPPPPPEEEEEQAPSRTPPATVRPSTPPPLTSQSLSTPVSPVNPASVLHLTNGDLLKGVIEKAPAGYQINDGRGARIFAISDVQAWYRNSREMIKPVENWLLEVRRCLDQSGRIASGSTADRIDLLKEASRRALFVQDWCVRAQTLFPLEKDVAVVELTTRAFMLGREIQSTLALANVVKAPVTPIQSAEPPPSRPLNTSYLQGLSWLAKHQGKDGSWRITGYIRECLKTRRLGTGPTCTPNPGHEDFDSGVTGLALLAFLGAGYSHVAKDTYDGICFGEVVRSGLQWMLSHQAPDGCIGSRNAQKYLYNHAVCTMALAEAYAQSDSDIFKPQVQKAIDFLIAAQNPGKGWRYSYKSGDNDSSVTGWATLALRSAGIAGLRVPKSAYNGCLAWFEEATDTNTARTGYTHKGTGKVFIPGANEQFDHHEAMTAIAVLTRALLAQGRPESDVLVRLGCNLIVRDLPQWDGNAIDFYYWYYGGLALYHAEGPSGARWKQWDQSLRAALLQHQNQPTVGCKAGSWEPVDRWSVEGGRVYATAIALLSLKNSLLPLPRRIPRSADGKSPEDGVPAVGGWVFHLHSGGRLNVLSYEESEDKYQLRLTVGTTSIPKGAVLRIEKWDGPLPK